MREKNISKELALRILRLHDLRPTDPTEFLNGTTTRNRAGTPDSTFYAMVGNRKAYSSAEVLAWLGY